jgi:hypothetical protein
MPDDKKETVGGAVDTSREVESGRDAESARPAAGKFVRLVKPVGRCAKALAKWALYAVYLCGAVGLALYGLDRLAAYSLRSPWSDVYPEHFERVRYDFTRPVSHYDYDFTPGVCIQYDLSKGNRFEYANNAGFRDHREISLKKPEDEYRIFIAGGSTAFGLGAVGEAAATIGTLPIEYRETISHCLEMILNATAPIPGKKIRVYNTAVWGYAYQHNLMRYITKLRRYDPDVVISIDGANEIPMLCKLDPSWDYFQEGQYNNIIKEMFEYKTAGLGSYLTLWLKNNTYLMARVWAGRDLFQDMSVSMMMQSQGFLDPRSARAEKSVEEASLLTDSNIATVVRMVENYHSAMKNDGVSHIFVLQPWFYSCAKPKTETEQKLASLTGMKEYFGIPSDKMYALLTTRIMESAKKLGYPVLDFTKYFDDVEEQVFTDWCHLTPGANYVLAKELALVLKRYVLQAPIEEYEKVDDKGSYFWDLAASGRVAYAPRPKAPQFRASHMLEGYPGEALYESDAAGPDEKLEVTVEFPRPFTFSRLRLVWGDAESVPKEWEVLYSSDGNEWKPFASGGKESVDSYSQWPGTEFYAAKPVEGRFVKYRPVNTDTRRIKLRSFSVGR